MKTIENKKTLLYVGAFNVQKKMCFSLKAVQIFEKSLNGFPTSKLFRDRRAGGLQLHRLSLYAGESIREAFEAATASSQRHFVTLLSRAAFVEAPIFSEGLKKT